MSTDKVGQSLYSIKDGGNELSLADGLSAVVHYSKNHSWPNIIWFYPLTAKVINYQIWNQYLSVPGFDNR